MSDNGHVEPEKTKEELAAERTKRFRAKPDSFVELDDIIVAAMVDDHGQIGVMIGAKGFKRSQYLIAQGEINYRITNVLHMMEAEIARQRSGGIITPDQVKPKGGILNFARRHK